MLGFSCIRRAAVAQKGWGIVRESDASGTAAVSALYDAYEQARLQALDRLSSPIPKPQTDDLLPDVVVGIVDYKYRLRPQWRQAIAKAFNVPNPAAVRLSIAWHGRLPNNFMSGIQKAVGVTFLSQQAADGPEFPLPPAWVTSAGKKAEIDSVVAAINAQQHLELLELSIVKAADGSIVPRATGGQTIVSVADVVKASCAESLAVCLCKHSQLEWVLSNCVHPAISARVNVRVVVLDDPSTPELVQIREQMQILVDDHAAAMRPLVVGEDKSIRVLPGMVVPLESVIRTPALVVRGEVLATGGTITKLMHNLKRFGNFVHHPESTTIKSSKVV